MTDRYSTEQKKLYDFDLNIGNDAGACLRCQREVVCARMNGAPFCASCLRDATMAIGEATRASRESADNYYYTDKARHKGAAGNTTMTGIFVRAKRVTSKMWDSVDIAELDNDSLDRWLRSRDSIEWPISVVFLLLGYPHR